MAEKFNWVKRMEINTNIGAAVESEAKRKNVISASEKIIDRMAHEYEWSRVAVNSLNGSVKGKVNSYNFVANDVHQLKQLYEVALRVFEEAIANSERTHNTVRDKGKSRAFDRMMKEYEEQLQTELGISNK